MLPNVALRTPLTFGPAAAPNSSVATPSSQASNAIAQAAMTNTSGGGTRARRAARAKTVSAAIRDEQDANSQVRAHARVPSPPYRVVSHPSQQGFWCGSRRLPSAINTQEPRKRLRVRYRHLAGEVLANVDQRMFRRQNPPFEQGEAPARTRCLPVRRRQRPYSVGMAQRCHE